MGDDLVESRRRLYSDLRGYSDFVASLHDYHSSLGQSWVMAESRASESAELADQWLLAANGEQHASSLVRYYRGRGVASAIALRLRSELRARAAARNLPNEGPFSARSSDDIRSFFN